MKTLASLIVALVIAAGYGIFATVKWSSAGARCDARIAQAGLAAAAEARTEYAQGLSTALQVAVDARADAAKAREVAASSTSERDVQIVRVPVTGECTMPPGLPSLTPAVQEARDAAGR